jgi:hypothetical protein
LRHLSALLTATVLALPGAGFADQKPATAGEQFSVAVCAQRLGYVAAETDVVVVTPSGAGDVGLGRFDAAQGGTGGQDLEVVAIDLSSCALVEVPVWVQDQLGKQLQAGEGPVTRFSAELFKSGVQYVRANQALQRDIGFLMRRAG